MLHRKFVIAAVVSLFAIALVITSGLMCSALSVGGKAPGFQLKSFSGQNIQLSDYTDKPTVVVFWASWCPHCVRELPVMDRLYKQYGGKVNFVGIDVDSNIPAGKDYVTKNRISFPIAVGSGGVQGAYQVTGIPAIFVLDRGGILKAKYAGEVDQNTIKSDLAKLGVK